MGGRYPGKFPAQAAAAANAPGISPGNPEAREISRRIPRELGNFPGNSTGNSPGDIPEIPTGDFPGFGFRRRFPGKFSGEFPGKLDAASRFPGNSTGNPSAMKCPGGFPWKSPRKIRARQPDFAVFRHSVMGALPRKRPYRNEAFGITV